MFRRSAVLVLTGIFMTTAAAATTEDNFQIRTTQDLVVLCTTPTDDPLFQSAIHMCQGFIVGVHHYHDAIRLGPAARPPLFCPPSPAPSRDDVVAGWTAWSTTSADDDGDVPVESVLRYLAKTYPCAG